MNNLTDKFSSKSKTLLSGLTPVPLETPTSIVQPQPNITTPPSSSHLYSFPTMASSNGKSKSNSTNTMATTTINPMAGKKQASPSTPSTAMDFFTFKWLFKKRSVPFPKKSSSSSISPGGLGTVGGVGSTTVADGSNGFNPAGGRGKSLSNSIRDFQSIPGTARPNRICHVTPILSCLTGDKNYKSTLRMKLSYSFGDIDEFSKWSTLDSAENQPLSPYSADEDHSMSSSYLPPSRRSNIDLARRESVTNSKYSTDECPTELCSLCLCEVPSPLMHTIWSCGCCFCVHCLRTYLTINIQENNNITNLTCPDAKCPTLKKVKKNGGIIGGTRLLSEVSNNSFTPQEIQLLVSDETYALFKRFKLYKEVEEDPNRTWCPKPNCDNICVITKPSVAKSAGTATTTTTTTSSLPSAASFSSKSTQSTKMSLSDDRSSFYCDNCNETYCTLCRKPWHQVPFCLPSGEEDDLLMLLNQSGSPSCVKNIKRCPRCSVWIERDDGCAQMMCRKCKHVFCWFCLQSLEDDFLLRHYDKGPCKNKLGHSRPSVLWHRTQVIAIFAGFGLLLLLASPLFLIASPCILCCNCCCGSSCKYMDDGEPNDEEDGFGVANL